MEVRSAMLFSFKSGDAVLVIIDEDYQINTVSGDVNTLRYLAADAELPNFKWRHNTGDPALRTVESEGCTYHGRVSGDRSIEYLFAHRKKTA